MGVRNPSVQSNTRVNTVLSLAAETVVVTTPPLTLPLDFAAVYLFWTVHITTGAGTTSVNYILRRGTGVSGAVIENSTVGDTVAGAVFAKRGGIYFDTPGAVAGQQYSLTVTQLGATGNGTVDDVCLIALAF